MIVYAVIGSEKVQREFNASYPSLRRWYDGPVSVITDLETGWSHGDYERIPYRHSFEGFGVKMVLPEYIDAQKTLFLDADLLVLRSLDEVWNLLDDHDFLIARDVHPTIGLAAKSDVGTRKWPREEIETTLRLVGFDRGYFNTGVFAWRPTKRTAKLFHIWHCEWLKHRLSSQYALVRALDYTGFRPYELHTSYNAYAGSFRSLEHAQQAGVRLCHYWADHPRLLHDAAKLAGAAEAVAS